MSRFGRWCGRHWLIIVLMLTSLGGGCVGLSVAWPHLFADPLTRAVAAYRQGDWDMASASAAACLKVRPEDRGALRVLARTAVRLRRDTAARDLYARLGGAAAMEPEDFYLFGTVIDRLGDHETARECWTAGLRAAPDHAELLRAMALDSLQGGQPNLAAGFARRLAKQPGWESRGDQILGEAQYEDDDPAEAANSWRRALDRDPSARGGPGPPARLRKRLARALMRVGRRGQAQAQLEAVLTSAADPEASWLLSRVFLLDGPTPKALAALKQGGSYRDEHSLEPEPARHVGSARCAECHRSIYQSQQGSLHARTFRRGSELADLPLPGHPLRDPVRPEVRHSISRLSGSIQFEARDRDRVQRALVAYALGSGDRGLTPVGLDEQKHLRELRLSHYADGPVWDVTTGHPPQPRPGEGFLGRFLSSDELRSCLFCHTTVARSARDQTDPESADRGIGCERCHGPGEVHLPAVRSRFPDLAIARPRAGSGPQVVALCAQCHSPLGREVTRTDPVAVRFPGTTLTWSRCYSNSGGLLDCLTCHSPHHDAEKAPAFYEAKCLGCHSTSTVSAGANPLSPTEESRRVICTVSPNKGCLPCHMPTVKIRIPHSKFTDHDIRVHPDMVPKDASREHSKPRQ
ncbi:MAG: tetratricopeptide repeat protein [Isosphaeraceae bacterium]